MFSASNKTPKVYETQTPGAGNLALLMKALGNMSQNMQGISKSAGTSVAEDRLAALSPEERQGLNLSDKFQGLSLTDDFRNKLAQADKDAMSAKVTADKNDFTTKRDRTLHGYNMARDKAREKARAKSGAGTGNGDKGLTINPEDERGMARLDEIIMENQTAIAANDTQDGIGLGEKNIIVEQAKKAKYDLLVKNGYNEKTAREMVYKESPMTKMLHKRIAGNVYKDKDEK